MAIVFHGKAWIGRERWLRDQIKLRAPELDDATLELRLNPYLSEDDPSWLAIPDDRKSMVIAR